MAGSTCQRFCFVSGMCVTNCNVGGSREMPPSQARRGAFGRADLRSVRGRRVPHAEGVYHEPERRCRRIPDGGDHQPGDPLVAHPRCTCPVPGTHKLRTPATRWRPAAHRSSVTARGASASAAEPVMPRSRRIALDMVALEGRNSRSGALDDVHGNGKRIPAEPGLCRNDLADSAKIRSRAACKT